MRFLAILVLAGASIGNGATVWDNGSPDQIDGVVSDSTLIYAQDNFTLTATTTLRSLVWWGGYTPAISSVTDSFTVEFRDGGGLLSSFAVSASRTPTSFAVLSLPVYVYAADILPGFTLNAGSYFIRIFDNTNGAPTSWFWANSSQTGDASAFQVGGGSTFTNLGELAFQLSDTAVVPEGATYLLSAIGLAGIFLARRRA